MKLGQVSFPVLALLFPGALTFASVLPAPGPQTRHLFSSEDR